MQADLIPFVNGVQHDWASVDVDILGRRPSGLTGIDFGVKRAKKNIYGKGRKVIARGYGNDEPTCAMECQNFEWDAILAAAQAAGYNSLVDIPPFPIVVKLIKKGETQTITYTIKYAEFVENKREYKQGEEEQKTKLEMICSEIQGL